MDGIRFFHGIPFAKPPVGGLRFHAPQPVAPSPVEMDATHLRGSAMQPGRKDVSEDCLYLNVFAPQGKGPYPVFVWIHGGGFTGGSPNDTDGSVFAKQGIVVVTVTYRLGVFGFVDWSPLLGPEYADSANNGVRDLVCALQWVQTNISSFGGDPSRVTIGGESAGAKLVAFLMGIDEAKPLFRSMISESGGGERILDRAAAARVTAAFAAQLKDRTAAGIKAAGAESLIRAQLAMTAAWPANFPLRPEAEGVLMPHRALPAIAAGSTRGKRLLIGTNRDENALYLGDHAAEHISQKRLANTTEAQFNAVLANYRKLYPEMSAADLNIRALTAEEYWVPSIRVAQAHARGGGTTYFYRLDETAAEGPHKGESYHSYDLGYVWGTLSAAEPPAAHNLARQMHDAWAAFIKDGPPAAAGLPPWPRWNPQERATMILNSTSRVETQPFEAELRLWDGFAFA
jgi:para-nitrobenzyl esterase